VNFFGHAMVAAWQSADPGFVLGAMLPDFATMIGARVPSVSHPDVKAGVTFHHDTDRVFHDAPTFRTLQADARRILRERGLPRPSALAVGHIGVEILLDSALANDAAGRAAYLEALRAGHPARLGAHMAWAHLTEAENYARLVVLLEERGIPSEAGGPGAAALRITRALSSRPRLRLDREGERVVREWAVSTAPVVTARADALIHEVVAGLALGGATFTLRPLRPEPSV
jgi:hypothetical protein